MSKVWLFLSNIQGLVVKVVDVANDFRNNQEFESRIQMLQWICMEDSKFGFGVVIRRSDNASNRICAFMTMICEILKDKLFNQMFFCLMNT